jgi:hypothetical protein
MTEETHKHGDDGSKPGAKKASGASGANHDTDAHEGKPTGAGAEAAEGIHTTPDRDESDNTARDDHPTARASGDRDQVGSEPLNRQREHKGSYGGEMGKPRTPSHEREPSDPTGDAK